MKTTQAMRRPKARQMAPARPYVAVLLALLAAWPLFLSAPAAAGDLTCGTVIATGCEAWTTIVSEGDIAWPYVTASRDGLKVIIATSSLTSGGLHLVVRAYDPSTGAPLWNTTYHPRGPTLTGVSISPDSRFFYIVGTHGPEFPPWGFLRAHDTRTGAAPWSYHWNPGTIPTAVVASPDSSRIYVVGWRFHNYNYMTVALDALTGQKLWEQTYDNHGAQAPDFYFPSYDAPYDVTTSPDGTSVYVTGKSAAADGTFGYATLAYDAATGARRWLARHQASSPMDPRHAGGFDLTTSPDGGRVYVMGSDGLLAYDAQTGADLWGKRTLGATCRHYFSASIEGECDVEASPDGSRVYAGTHNSIAAYDAATGDLLWLLPLMVGDEDDTISATLGNGIRLSLDGSRLYAISSGSRDPRVTPSAASDNFETIAVNALDGTPVWRAVYDRRWDKPTDLALSPDGKRVFVAGESVIREPTDMVLLAYDTDLGLENKPHLAI